MSQLPRVGSPRDSERRSDPGLNEAILSGLKWGTNTVVRDQRLGLGEIGRDAGRGDGFAVFDSLGDFQVQGKELGEQILPGAEAVSGEDGGVQGGVGAFESVANRGGGTMILGTRRVAERRVSRLRGGLDFYSPRSLGFDLVAREACHPVFCTTVPVFPPVARKND